MNKGLENIKHLLETHLGELTKEEEQDLDTIEKELKALEIIKKKLPPLMRSALLDYCNKDEYNLLKEVLL